VKPGITSIYHNVSKDYLHRDLWQFDFLWNDRTLNDGDRTALRSRRRKASGYATRARTPPKPTITSPPAAPYLSRPSEG
jgi:hypothetical protein